MPEHDGSGETPVEETPVEQAPEPEAAATRTETSTANADLKTYRFTESTRDFGSIVPLAGINTVRGFVRRGETIDLTSDEAGRLNAAGYTFLEVTD